jgi:hypothetical protein
VHSPELQVSTSFCNKQFINEDLPEFETPRIGIYSKHELYLQQFVYEYDNVIDLDIISFPNNRGHFGFIHQFKNGEIILDANGIIYILN